MTIANLGIAVQSGPAASAAVDLDKLAASARSAEAATDALGAESREAAAAMGQASAAANAEAAANTKVTATTRMHTAALQAQGAASRMASMQQRNLIFQLNDIGVSLASGMNPMMVAIQQGSQIATIYEGGVVPALRETAAMAGRAAAAFWPIGLAVGAAVAAVAGLTYEINKTAEVQVGFFDVALAGWQLFAEGVASLVAPVFGAIGSWLQQGWDAAAPILKGIGNTIVGTFAFAVQAVGALWNGLPAAVGDAIIKTANIVVAGVEWSINKAAEFINGFIGKYNEGLAAMGQATLPTFGGVSIPRSTNPFEGSMDTLGRDLGDAGSSAFGTDYLGGAFDAVSVRAQEIAAAKDALDGVGGAAKEANDNVKKLADDGLSAAAQKADEFADKLGQGIGGAFRSLIDGSKSAKEAIGDLLGELGKFFAMQAAQAFGSGPLGFVGSLLSGLFGGGFANGGAFNAGMQIEPFARGGVVSRPTMFPMANGAGLMGEAGPEAIMPLRRGPDGRLGVAAANQTSSVQVHVTVGVDIDGSGNILPFVKNVSQETVAQAAPAIVATSVNQSNKQAPAAMAQYQRQRAGGDYRLE